MANALTLQQPWFGRYPERVDSLQLSRDRQLWRTLATPLWSQRLLMRNATRFVRAVDSHRSAIEALSQEQLADSTRTLRRAFSLQGLQPTLCAQAFAIVAEVAARELGLRPYACQLIGGWAMLNGKLAEMDTGEGKTLSIALAAATAALAHLRTHVITVNDYLVERDARELAPLYTALGLRVVGITADMLAAAERREAWHSDVIYCSNKGLVFDYLRDRVAMGARQGMLHRELDALAGGAQPLLAGLQFGIVDEADSVLIDECRTPLILSRERPPIYDAAVFSTALSLAGQLTATQHYLILQEQRRVEFTDAGKAALLEKSTVCGEFWTANRRREELVRQALTAQHLFKRDEHYLVRDNKVQIIDASTGRIMPDRTWELGLQQMIETRESCQLTGARETMARITYQRFFGRYQRLGGASGTAREVAGELWRVYGLRVLRVPRHKPSVLLSIGTSVQLCASSWHEKVVARIRELHALQRPVLVATCTVAASEAMSRALTEAQLPHFTLNANHDAAESAIVAKAGQAGCITVATNMAGRGTDIKLGSGVSALGGLHVIATELNDSARLDRQLAGRAGRQSDPGSFERILSLQDELVSRHVPMWLAMRLQRMLSRRSTLGMVLARWMFRSLQLRFEATSARQRRFALTEDRRIAGALSFAGSVE